MSRKIAFLAIAALLAVMPFLTANAQVSGLSRQAGEFYAPSYAWRGAVLLGNAATGSQTVVMGPSIVSLPDGRQFHPFGPTDNLLTPVTFDIGTNNETVTPTAVSVATCPFTGQFAPPAQCISFTGSFNNTHGINTVAVSGSDGAQEAAFDAFAQGGGDVIVDAAWSQLGGTDVMLYALVPLSNVSITDKRKGVPQYWNLASNTTVLAVPTALTAQAACDSSHQFCSDATVAGSASWGGTVHGCVTYVDIMGNESVCSTDASFTSVASKAIDVASPAASTGAVGWRLYLSTSGGTYANALSIPLLTQPTVLLAAPTSSGVCTLEFLSPEPACALANTTYGEVTSTLGVNSLFNGGAQVTGYPVVTSVLNPNLDSASAQSLNPQSGGHTIYKYVPSSHTGIPGVMTASQTFPITTAAQSTIGQVAGTIKLPANFMNYVGRTIEVCGMLSKTSTNADTITNIQLWWDNEGSNTSTGVAVQLSNIQITQTNTAAATYSFCQDITTTVAAAGATGGTITPGSGWMDTTQVAAGTLFAGVANSLFAAVGSLNLALPANLEIVYNHTTGTDGAGVLLINPTVRIVN